MSTIATSYPITALPFTAVRIDDAFWSPRIETNRRVTVPYDFQKCEETGRIANFAKAAGQQPGAHGGIFFNDSDVFKVIEGAAYALMLHPDPNLDAYLDKLIALIAAAGAGRLSLHRTHHRRAQRDAGRTARRPRGVDALVQPAHQP
ncbi:MAG: glycoside hydrolase family 127 protein [Anaerolineales bacterium]|nr:glycoside hydrolase family 127 protein [Anaerolineales bacterium]